MAKNKQQIDTDNVPPVDEQTPSDPAQNTAPETGDDAVSNVEAINVDDVRSLVESFQTLQKERNELYDRCVRSQAEFENYRKRAQKEAEQERQYATMPLVRSLLPGLDNLQRAIAAAQGAGESSPMIEGVELVLKEFHSVLEKFGVQPIAALGEHFDPNVHEALQQIPSPDHEPWTIIQELERGYVMHDRVIRPSRVIVASAPAES